MVWRRSHHKYNAKPKVVDNIRFASTHEADRYQILRMMQAAGLIKDLTLQNRFPLYVENVLICHYVADFVYYENERRVVEDAKGVRTPEYILKKKLFEALYRQPIKET